MIPVKFLVLAFVSIAILSGIAISNSSKMPNLTSDQL